MYVYIYIYIYIIPPGRPRGTLARRAAEVTDVYLSTECTRLVNNKTIIMNILSTCLQNVYLSQ